MAAWLYSELNQHPLGAENSTDRLRRAVNSEEYLARMADKMSTEIVK